MECAQGQSPEVPCREFKGSGGFAQKGLSAKDIRKDEKTTVTTVALFQGPGRPVAGSLTGNTKHGTNLKRKSQYCSIEPDLSHTPVAQMEDQAGTVAQIDLRLR